VSEPDATADAPNVAETSANQPALPDRLSVNPTSPYFNRVVMEREIGVRFNGVEKTNVEEYCISEGWIRVAAGKAKDRFGNPVTVKLSGLVEAWIKG
jgi:hypothetical protein